MNTIGRHFSPNAVKRAEGSERMQGLKGPEHVLILWGSWMLHPKHGEIVTMARERGFTVLKESPY